jgi:hypothetical protein
VARIRTIKPEFWSDEKVARCSRDARLTFWGLVSEADDEGRMLYVPKKLAGVIYPHDDDVTPRRFDGWVRELEGQGIVVIYEAHGFWYLAFLNWQKHQKISHPKPRGYPPPPERFRNGSGMAPESDPHRSGELPELDQTESREPPESLRSSRAGVEQGTGNREQGTGRGARRATGPPEEFQITDRLKRWADENARGIDLTRETARFLDHHRAKGSVFKDWGAAWRNWMGRAVDFKPANGRAESSAKPRPDRHCPCGERMGASDEGQERCFLCRAEEKAQVNT